jgi:uncharacterized protein Ymh
LMERAFEKNGPLRLSDENQEQIRAKQVYRGVMTFFRNAAGHNVTDSYTQEDALRFAVLADLFLAMVEVSYGIRLKSFRGIMPTAATNSSW